MQRSERRLFGDKKLLTRDPRLSTLTPMVVELILAALAISAAGSAVLAYRRQRRQKAEHTAALMAPRRLEAGELLPDDVIVHLGTDYLVQGVTTLSEANRTVLVVAWMTDGAEDRCLVVTPKERPRYILAELQHIDGLGDVVPAWVPSGGLELKLLKRASVRMRNGGETTFPVEGVCEFGLFGGPGHRRAAALLVKGKLLLLMGVSVIDGALELLPGGSAVLQGE